MGLADFRYQFHDPSVAGQYFSLPPVQDRNEGLLQVLNEASIDWRRPRDCNS